MSMKLDEITGEGDWVQLSEERSRMGGVGRRGRTSRGSWGWGLASRAGEGLRDTGVATAGDGIPGQAAVCRPQ